MTTHQTASRCVLVHMFGTDEAVLYAPVLAGGSFELIGLAVPRSGPGDVFGGVNRRGGCPKAVFIYPENDAECHVSGARS